MMKVTFIGAGYVGGPCASLIAYKCPHLNVVVLDISAPRIAAWEAGDLPIYEPGLEDIVRECKSREHPNLTFSTDAAAHIPDAEVIFVCVNTPTKTSGVGAGKAATFVYWEAAARLIAACCVGREVCPKVIVEKSTVPVKTAQAMSRVLLACMAGPTAQFEVVSCPEFFSAGNAVEEFLNPDRVLIGHRDTPAGVAAADKVASIYTAFVAPERILHMSLWSSEVAKLAVNAFLAQRIASINTISALCEATGSDVQEVAHAIGTDTRIGMQYLRASVGFGGPSLEKHLLNLVYICESLELQAVAAYFQTIVSINSWQKNRFVQRVIGGMFNTARNKRVAVLGFAYKAKTTDTRDSAAIDVCWGLMADGASLSVYDPKVAAEQIHLDLALPKGCLEHTQPSRLRASAVSLATVTVADSVMAACVGSHAVCVLTDWREFRDADWAAIYTSMAKPAFIFDGCNVLDHAQLRGIGYVVYAMGKPLDPFFRQAGQEM